MHLPQKRTRKQCNSKIEQEEYRFTKAKTVEDSENVTQPCKIPLGKNNIIVKYVILCLVKTTRYFKEQVLRKRQYLKLKWINETIKKPVSTEIQSDERIRYWIYIPELGKYLRVITLADGKTVHNAFPDHKFKGVKS